jgi:FAD/FMN-containing dehydrogenase
MNLNWGWTSASDDAVVLGAVDRFVSRSVDIARQMALDHRFIYMNYASQDQDVFAGYGTNNERKLERIRRQYDPDGVFERLQPGYFKLK